MPRLKQVVMLIIDHDEDGTVGVVLTHGLQNELVVMGSHRLATIQCSLQQNRQVPTQASCGCAYTCEVSIARMYTRLGLCENRTYVYMYVIIRIVYIYICIHVCVCVSNAGYWCTHASAFTAHMHACIHTCIHTYICTYIPYIHA